METLQRAELVKTETETLDVGMVKDCKKLFGYTYKQPSSLTDIAAFEAALIKLGIKPFDSAKVNEYKQRRLRDVAKIVQVVILFGCIFGFLGSMLIGAITVSQWAMLPLAIFLAGAIIAANFPWPTTQRYWKRDTLKGYSKPVPEFSLQTAIDLAKECDAATFCIDELIEENRLVDPFLVAIVGNGEHRKEYYLEVWNEPGFKAKREV